MCFDQNSPPEGLVDGTRDQREGMTVGDDALDAEVNAMAAREGQAPERVRAFYDRPEARSALRARLTRQRALDHVLGSAKIVPVAATEEVAREK